MEVERVDVAIIGGGPGGSTLAALLAMKGLDVALIERDTFPRDKLCGEFLSYDALPILEHLGITGAFDEAGAPSIRTCRLVGSRRVVDIALPSPARGVSRLMLDPLIFRRASELGARTFEGWSAGSIVRSDQLFHVDVTRDDEARRIDAEVVAGAWGKWGRFDLTLGRTFVTERSRHFGFKRHYEPLSPRDNSVIELHSFDGGYLGVSGVEGDRTNVCGLVHARRMQGLKGGWVPFVDTIARQHHGFNAVLEAHRPAQSEFLSCEPVIFRGRSSVENGIFLLGDAAGLIDPLAGNGMTIAIQSALIAASAIEGLVRGTLSRVEAESHYQEEHARWFAGRIRWSRRIAKLLSNPALLDTALAIAPRAAGRSLIEKTRSRTEDVARRIDAWR